MPVTTLYLIFLEIGMIGAKYVNNAEYKFSGIDTILVTLAVAFDVALWLHILTSKKDK